SSHTHTRTPSQAAKTPPPPAHTEKTNTATLSQNKIPCKTFAELVKEDVKLSSSQIPAAQHDTAAPARLPGAARRNLTKTLGSPETPGKRRGDVLDEGSLLTSSKKVRLRDGLTDDDLGVSNLLSETPLFKSKVAIKIRDDSRRESLQKTVEMDTGLILSPPNKTANPNTLPWQTVPASKKLPSIQISNVQQIIPLIEKLNCKAGISNFSTRTEPGGNIRIHAKTTEAYKAIQDVLQTEHIPRHSYQQKGLKGFHIVIRHLHQSTPIKWVESHLKEIGIATTFIRAMQYRDTKNPMRIHEVEVVQKPDGSHRKVLLLTSLGGQTVKVERKRVARDPVQCHRCQNFGHTKNYCRNPFKCMKCGQLHATVLCNKPRHIPAYCANCKGNHVCSYKGCPVFQEAKQCLAVNKIQDQNTQPTHAQTPRYEKPKLPPTTISAQDTKLRAKRSDGKTLTKRNLSINKRLGRFRTLERKPKKESSPPTTSKHSIATLENDRKNPKSVLNPANTHLFHFRPPPMAQNLPEEVQKNAILEPNLLKRIESMEEKINNLLEIVTRLVQKDITGPIFPKNPSEAKGQNSFRHTGIVTSRMTQTGNRETLKIAFWNACGVNNKVDELKLYIQNKNAHIVIVTETRLDNKSTKLEFPGYVTYLAQNPFSSKRGGVATIVSSRVRHTALEPIEQECIQSAPIVLLPENNRRSEMIVIASVYCPPQHKWSSSHFRDILNYAEKTLEGRTKFVLCGDWNAKHRQWGCFRGCQRGAALYDAVKADTMAEIIATGCATHFPFDSRKNPSAIDFSICKGLGMYEKKISSSSDLSSDHLPILLEINLDRNTFFLHKQNNSILKKTTNIELFKNALDRKVLLNTEIRVAQDINDAINIIIKKITDSATEATPPPDYLTTPEAGTGEQTGIVILSH
ncbi:uncharacterized protein LOC122625459, partial [Drosophila teissieri]|uniref:uncharacterized protein LOC122625459 n=1 Tax=Drosophila teissieri TaxID=7243 RepID=UPI001CBA0B0C